MLHINNEHCRLAHPQAGQFPLSIWNQIFNEQISFSEIDFMQRVQTSTASLDDMLQISEDLSVSSSMRRWCCLAYGQPSTNDEMLYQFARRLNLPLQNLFNLAALTGKHTLLNRIITENPGESLAMLQADDYEAFQYAARSGNIHAINRLIELAGANAQAMLQAGNYEAFQYAAYSGNIPAINRLIELAGDNAQAMLQACNYAAFQNAAYSGNIHAINRLIELAGDNAQTMLQADYYEAFQYAALSGNIHAINRLIELAGANAQTMLQAGNYAAFQNAAHSGNIHAINRLIELAGADVQTMLQAGNYEAFQNAAYSGNIHAINRLIELAGDNAQTMLQADNYKAFQNAARSGNIPAINRLIELAGANVQTMLQARDYAAFQNAAYSGNIHAINRLIELAGDNVQTMLQAGNYKAFQNAASSGNIPAINRLIELAGDNAQTMLQACDYAAFQNAARSGNIPAINRLIELAGDNVQTMLQACDYAAFQNAALSGNIPAINRLIELAGDNAQTMLQACNYAAFQNAARSGNIHAINRLIELAGDNVQTMLQADNYRAFQNAARSGNIHAINRLIELAGDNVQTMLQADNYQAFQNATRNGNSHIMAHLMSYPTVFAYAESHLHEYGQHTRRFMTAKLTAFKELKRAFETAHPNEVFNLEDPAVAHLCFYLMRHIIRLNDRALDDDLRFLLSIPSVRALAHTRVLGGQENELLRLAQNTGNPEAANLLLDIPAVRELAERNDFYRAEERRGLDLSQLARDRESSMHALTTGEQQRLAQAIEAYKLTMDGAGVPFLMELLRAQLIERYHTHPATSTRDEGTPFTLPLTYEEYRALALSADEQKRALEAYYQHKNHTALRYLSKPNAWMHPRAGYVYINEARTERWSTFEEYQPLIVMLWLAAQDSTREPTEGFTLESRLEHFIDELAHIGRAHNWDDTRIKRDAAGAPVLDASGTPVEEEYDNLEGDRPSCFSGVKRRLFQSVLGHPLLQMLDRDKLVQEIKSFVRGHFATFIKTDADKASLKAAFDAHIANAGQDSPATDPLLALNLSAAHIEGFIQQIEVKYGGQLRAEPAFMAEIARKFAFKKDDYAHVLTLDGLVNFQQMVSPPLVGPGPLGVFGGAAAAASETSLAEEQASCLR